MKVQRHCVFTIERTRREWEEYDVSKNRFAKFTEVIKEPRYTYCDSYEEAKEFMREIGLRMHPQVVFTRYAGLQPYHA